MSAELKNVQAAPQKHGDDASSDDSRVALNSDSLIPPHFRILTYAVVALILGFIAVVMYWSLNSQLDAYKQGISNAVQDKSIDHAAVLAYSLSITVSVVKISSVFLAFLMIFLGGIYLLLPLHAAYSLSGETNAAKGSLTSTSPGLIVITLGVTLASVTLITKSDVNYTSPVKTWEQPTNQAMNDYTPPNTNYTTAP